MCFGCLTTLVVTVLVTGVVLLCLLGVVYAACLTSVLWLFDFMGLCCCV